MKIKTRKSTRLPIVLSILVGLLVIGGTVYALEKAQIIDFIKDPSQPNTSTKNTLSKRQEVDTSASDAAQKEKFIDESTKSENQPIPAQVPTKSDTITLNASQSGGAVTVYTQLVGQGYSSGTCRLTISNGQKSVAQTAEVMYQPEYSTCAGFSVPVSSVGAGTWSLKLEVTPFNGSPITQSTTLEVT